jgi:hypothetical protein
LFEQLGDQSGPSGLVVGSDARSVVAMKIFVEEYQVTPIWIVLKILQRPRDWTTAVDSSKKDMSKPFRNFAGHLP